MSGECDNCGEHCMDCQCATHRLRQRVEAIVGGHGFVTITVADAKQILDGAESKDSAHSGQPEDKLNPSREASDPIDLGADYYSLMNKVTALEAALSAIHHEADQAQRFLSEDTDIEAVLNNIAIMADRSLGRTDGGEE